ncbi:hypothetical protein GCM10025768_06790 [Microbacterium pseudoresistens]|uniref:Uncharacterized protein n=1 Tax=Microbacterium pseudoresistens TaxID=640634 RepID=A0A7Y9JMY6_9MICO|nr:hypothetical protein [Microbacterium pseudoresistens]NYD54516.1 hypothetical protein [Microbacterium pseudoresistens]
MARIAGRKTALTWVAGVFCAGVIALLGYLAIPMLPVIGDYVAGMVRSLIG